MGHRAERRGEKRPLPQMSPQDVVVVDTPPSNFNFNESGLNSNEITA